MAKRQGSLASRLSQFEQKKNTPTLKPAVEQDTGYVQKVVKVKKPKTKTWKDASKEYERVHIVVEKDLWKKVKLGLIDSENFKYESQAVNQILTKFFQDHPSGDLDKSL